MHRTITALIALGVLAALPACNTVEGMGKDVEATGKTLQDWAGDDDSEEAPTAEADGANTQEL